MGKDAGVIGPEDAPLREPNGVSRRAARLLLGEPNGVSRRAVGLHLLRDYLLRGDQQKEASVRRLLRERRSIRWVDGNVRVSTLLGTGNISSKAVSGINALAGPWTPQFSKLYVLTLSKYLHRTTYITRRRSGLYRAYYRDYEHLSKNRWLDTFPHAAESLASSCCPDLVRIVEHLQKTRHPWTVKLQTLVSIVQARGASTP